MTAYIEELPPPRERTQAEQTIKSLSEFVKPVRQLYKCEVCGMTWMKWFFTHLMFKGFPRVRFCGKVCRSKRHEKKTT